MQGQFGTDYPALMAGALICTLPLVIVFVVLATAVLRGHRQQRVEGLRHD